MLSAQLGRVDALRILGLLDQIMFLTDGSIEITSRADLADDYGTVFDKASLIATIIRDLPSR